MFQNWEHTQLSTQSTFICNCVHGLKLLTAKSKSELESC